MRKLLLLIALPLHAFSQAISLPKPGPAKLDGATVCLTLPVAAKVRDSLNVLPLVRKEAKHLRASASSYKLAADTMRAAYVTQLQSGANLSLALREQKIETTRARLDAKQWRDKARRRSWLNWLGVVALGIGAGLAITH